MVSKYSKSVNILQQYPPSFWWSDAPKTRWPECHLTQMSRPVTPLSGPSQRSTDYRAISCQPLSNHLSICSTLVISPKRFPPLPQSQPKMVGQEEEENTCCRYAGSAGTYLGISFILSKITTAYDGLRANEASDCLIEIISHSDVLHRFISISRLLSQEKWNYSMDSSQVICFYFSSWKSTVGVWLKWVTELELTHVPKSQLGLTYMPKSQPRLTHVPNFILDEPAQADHCNEQGTGCWYMQKKSSISGQVTLTKTLEALWPVREVDMGTLGSDNVFSLSKKPIIGASQKCTFTKDNRHNQCWILYFHTKWESEKKWIERGTFWDGHSSHAKDGWLRSQFEVG